MKNPGAEIWFIRRGLHGKEDPKAYYICDETKPRRREAKHFLQSCGAIAGPFRTLNAARTAAIVLGKPDA
jgi:hypothetical protein